MPTGYTAGIADGSISTLRQFALTCARGMGAAIQMRDDPMDKPIPDQFAPDTSYYDRRLAKAWQLLEEIPLLTSGQCDARAESEYQSRLADHVKYETDRAAKNERYREMLARVREWKTGAEGIKDFMTQQIEVSIDDYVSEPPKNLTGAEWRHETIEKAVKDIGYCEKQRAEEIARTEDRNRWLAALRASLPPEAAQ